MNPGGPDVQLVPDDDGRGGVTVVMDGSPPSHVSLDDPAYLAFEYVQHLATVIDTLPDGPLAVTHVGGAAMTLARYVSAARPGSPQIVLEPNVALTELVRRELPLPRRHRIRVRPQDGLTGVAGLADASADVVVLDAYAGARVPAELTTVQFLTDVARVLRPDGLALLNLADEPGLRYVARVLAGLREAVGEVAVIASHEVLKGKRFGNVVAVASGGALDVTGLRRAAARAPLPTGVRDAAQLARQVGRVRPWTVAESAPSPAPPPARVWRRR
jgi:spermidine synthase